MDRLESFLSRFSKVRKTPNGWQACCPAHEDKKASLSISVTEGKILLHDHAGCYPEAILEAVGLKLKNLFLEPKAPAKPEVVATYDYTDEAGLLLEPRKKATLRPRFRPCFHRESLETQYDFNLS